MPNGELDTTALQKNEIVVWVGLEGEPYEYRIVYCPGRSPVIHRVIHGELDDYFEEISTDNLEIREIMDTIHKLVHGHLLNFMTMMWSQSM